MSGERIGGLSLGIDAAYCVVLGALIAAFASPIAQTVPMVPLAIVAFGVAVSAWGVLVEVMRRRLPLRRALLIVMTANIIAACAVAAVSAVAVAWLAALAIIAIAVDVALFAVSQAVALRRLATLGA